MLVPLLGRRERLGTYPGEPTGDRVVTTGQGSMAPAARSPPGYHDEQTPTCRCVSCSLSWTPKWK